MKAEDSIKIPNKDQQLSVQNLDLSWQFTLQQDNDPKHLSKSVTVASEKEHYSSAMAFSESWLESCWKSMESLNM